MKLNWGNFAPGVVSRDDDHEDDDDDDDDGSHQQRHPQTSVATVARLFGWSAGWPPPAWA